MLISFRIDLTFFGFYMGGDIGYLNIFKVGKLERKQHNSSSLG